MAGYNIRSLEKRQPPTIFISKNKIFRHLKANGEDQVADLIRLSSEIYRHSSLENFCLDLKLHPQSSTPSIRSSANYFLGWEAYYFDITSWVADSLTLRIRLLPPPLSKSGKPLACPTVQVEYNDNWLSIPAFLDVYPPAQDCRYQNAEKPAQYLYDDQFRWWTALSNLPHINPQRKVFRILALPAEIRESIYGYVFPSPLRPFPGAKCRGLSGMTAMAFKAAQPLATILLLNKQIYHEANHVLFSDTTWEVTHPNLLNRILFTPNLQSRIQRLDLRFTHAKFIKMFAASSETGIARLRPLRSMKLRELVLDFEAPPGSWSPWISWQGSAMLVCQRLVIDKILRVAEPWIVGHEGVRLVGWVKTVQKSVFEELCEAKVREFRKWKEISGKTEAELEEWDEWNKEMLDEEDGGVRLVEEEEPAEVTGGERDESRDEEERTSARHSGEYEPECLCEVSCGHEGWTADD